MDTTSDASADDFLRSMGERYIASRQRLFTVEAEFKGAATQYRDGTFLNGRRLRIAVGTDGGRCLFDAHSGELLHAWWPSQSSDAASSR